MLRVSKRCRLLVSLLLLCGCFLSFSSVSFAEDPVLSGEQVSVSTPQIPARGYSFSTPDGSSVVVQSVFTSFITNIRNSIYTSDGTYLVNLDCVLDGYIRISNPSSTDYYLNSKGFMLTNFDTSLDYTFSGGGYFTANSDLVLSSVSLSQASWSNFWLSTYDGGKINFRPIGLLNYNDYIAVPKNTTIILPFSITFTQSLYSNNVSYPSFLRSVKYNLNSYSFYLLDTDSGGSALIPTSSPLPPIYSDSAIYESIQSQTQQQQQQYDDFTNDGASQGESFITDTDSTVKEKIGIFTFLDTLLENLLGLFAAPEGDAVITFPAFSMEVGGETHQIWADTQFNLSSLDDDFSVLLSAVRFGTVATVYFALINFLGDTYSRIFGGKSE